MKRPLGAYFTPEAVHFSVRARQATAVELCLFEDDRETRIWMERDGDYYVKTVPGIQTGQRYGFRAHGNWAPQNGQFFDPAKLLVDPYAKLLDKRFSYDSCLSEFGKDTAPLVPKARVAEPHQLLPQKAPLFRSGGLIYELNVKGFSIRHPEIPASIRGTIAALAHPANISHFKKLHVSAIELMPIVAWLDERHLKPLGLRNAWGYNPIVPMALDPELAPGGYKELSATVAALRDAGIGVILDLVFNHTGESDIEGPILSFRGLDNRSYMHDTSGRLVNYTGTGNTLNTADPGVQTLILDSLRYFAGSGIDGFRFDLATILARDPEFDRYAPIFSKIAEDDILHDRILIAEPWDVGPNGYQLGQFPPNWLEWNDRYRDDVRRFWRGDCLTAGTLATRMMGSSDIFSGSRCRSVNFVASHDGFSLLDLVSYATKHNEQNGEQNQDGHADNISWNNGVEGPTDDLHIIEERNKCCRALLATLFASRGTLMLCAGDEFGRTQRGNNNAYAQDNEITWLNWESRNTDLEDFVANLACRRIKCISNDADAFVQDASWLDLSGDAMTPQKWNDVSLTGFYVEIRTSCGSVMIIRVDQAARQCTFRLEL